MADVSAQETVLLVEDDASVSAMLRRHLVRAGFVVYEATTVDDAVRRASEVTPSVTILDLGLADGEGGEVCRRIRDLPRVGDMAILVLTARGDLQSKVLLFALGADDYVVKPCDPLELVARIHSLLRRTKDPRVVRRIGPLRVAIATGDAWIGDRQLDLTTGERAVLTHLARAHPSLTPRAALDAAPWRQSDVTSNVTEVLVGRLRHKISAAGGGVEIRAVRRSGYVLRASAITTEVAT